MKDFNAVSLRPVKSQIKLLVSCFNFCFTSNMYRTEVVNLYALDIHVIAFDRFFKFFKVPRSAFSKNVISPFIRGKEHNQR